MNWKEIPGFEGRYEVSDTGLVRNWTTWQVRKTRVANDGALTVSFRTGKQYKSFRLNRLVATLFIPNPNGYRYVRYKDGNKENLSIDNLYWSPYKQDLMLKKVVPGKVYRNKKHGTLYAVYTFVRHSENLETMVAYGPLTASLDSTPWVRALDLFRKKFEEVEETQEKLTV